MFVPALQWRKCLCTEENVFVHRRVFVHCIGENICALQVEGNLSNRGGIATAAAAGKWLKQLTLQSQTCKLARRQIQKYRRQIQK